MHEDSKQNISNASNFIFCVDCVVFGYDAGKLKVLLIESDLPQYKRDLSLLGDLILQNEDLDDACYRMLRQRTGLSNVFIEQVKTFGSVNRHPLGRYISTAYFSLINLRDHQLKIQDHAMHWHPVSEITRLALDHYLILNTCLSALKKRIQEEPIIFNLLERKFSLRDLKLAHEQILGVEIDRRNFRKKFFANGLLSDENEMEKNVKHRPGRLYSFNFKAYERLGTKKFLL